MRVKFVIFDGELTALFPDEKHNHFDKDLITCYAHIGQHSCAHKSLMECEEATKEQYEPLLDELKRVGYDDLEVMNFDESSSDDPLNEEERKIYDQLYTKGFCIVVFTPEELKGADPTKVQDRLTELGWEVIHDLKTDDDEEE